MGASLGISNRKADIRRIAKVLAEVGATARAEARLCLVGDGAAVAQLATALSAGAADITEGVSASVAVLTPEEFSRQSDLRHRWGAVVLVADAGPEPDGVGVVASARAGGGVVFAVVPSGGAQVPPEWLTAAGFAAKDVVTEDFADETRGEATAERLAAVCGDTALSLARRLPVVRRAVVRRLIAHTARQNGVVGAVVFIPGADMPVMTLNQVRMVLKMAAAYGQDIGLERAGEILSVLTAGLGLRTLAREALDFVPVAGWALNGAVGYSGTVAIGTAAQAYFEAGAPLMPTKAKRIAERLDRLTHGILARGLASG
jgi:uncharacterized protein (DUF697 family)